MTHVPSATINGLGRFGLGLLSAWFSDRDRTYRIKRINDDVLTIHQIAAIMQRDPIVNTFHNADVDCRGERLSLVDRDGLRHTIQVTTGELGSTLGRDRPRLLFDCSGRAANFVKYRSTLRDAADLVLIGATTDVADTTLVMGHNEADFDAANHRIVSFGSCTVIPGIHVIKRLHSSFGLRAALVNIVHSVPRWRLEAGEWPGLVRKVCSLEAAAAVLIPSLPPLVTKVNYTYAPYAGVSLMDFGFTLVRPGTAGQIVEALSAGEIVSREESIVGLVESDEGGHAHIHAQTSIDVVLSSLDVRDDRVYFFGYFNNDGSGNRLHELAKSLLKRMM